MDDRNWLLWDGECDVCRRSAQWLGERDRRGVLTIIPYQEAPSPPMTPALRVQAAKAVQLITNHGQRFAGASAILFVLRQMGWHPRVARFLMRRPMIWVAEMAYRLVARNRRRLGAIMR